MTKRKEEGINDELIDKLIKERGHSREAILGEKGLVAELTRRVVERALAGELTHHLGYAKGEEKPEGKEDNHRNGYSRKTVIGDLPYVFSHDPLSNLPVLRKITAAWRSDEMADLLEITTDKGIVVRCTRYHEFPLRGGRVVFAKDLLPGMRLRKIGRWENKKRGNRRYLNHRETEQAPNGTVILVRWMWEQVKGPIPEGYEVHHLNGNRTDDRLSNLTIVKEADHLSYHGTGFRNPRFISVSDQQLLCPVAKQAYFGLAAAGGWSGAELRGIYRK